MRIVIIAMEFAVDVVAHRVQVGTEPFRLPDLSVGQRLQEPFKGLLAYVVDVFGRAPARTQLDLDQFREVSTKVLLRATIPRPQPFDVGIVKGVELQELTPATGEWQTV